MKKKTQSIRFRCSEGLYEFIESLKDSNNGNMDRSEVVRNILNIFRASFLLDEMDLKNMQKRLKEEMKERFESVDGENEKATPKEN